jgi:uncharacterized protein (TIGR00290 family)
MDGDAVIAWMSWSTGKDSAYALHVAQHDLGLDVRALVCTVNTDADRVAMHAVRRDLLLAQAERLDLPLHTIEIPSSCSFDVYEARLGAGVAAAVAAGAQVMIFGDLFLEDVRSYRHSFLDGRDVDPVLPLWGRPTSVLAREIIDAGVRAVITCVDPRQLAPEFVGRHFDHDLLADLPPTVDPCGENGEFHTFVWDTPRFGSPIRIELGDRVVRDGFVFCDVIPEA